MPSPLPFDLEFISTLAAVRDPIATLFFQACTWLGEVEGYVLVVALLHVSLDKRLAVRLAVLALASMSVNHLLKTWIANPRPFVAAGTHTEHWAVSADKASELAAEYSTPSGHAMAGASFYGALAAWLRSNAARAWAVAAIVFMGLSRPYLGVHYVEDVLLGWGLGIVAALMAVRFGHVPTAWWNGLSTSGQATALAALSLGVWLATASHYDDNPHGRPMPFVRYLGLMTGVLLAARLEERWVRFDPSRGSIAQKGARLVLSIALIGGGLATTELVFDRIGPLAPPLEDGVRFARYAFAGLLGVLAAPYLFVRLGLASAAPASPRSETV